MKQMNLTLRLVKEVDFRKSEATNFEEMKKKERLQIHGSDVVCFRSQSRNQVVFVWAPTTINLSEYGKKGAAIVFRSQRLRLSHGTWDPLMLQNYAEALGIHLVGIKRLEDYVAAVRREPSSKTAPKLVRGKGHLRVVA